MNYETPEIVEIGQAEEMVLGGGTYYPDCCSCGSKKENIDSDYETV
jgi:hypothetical protein